MTASEKRQAVIKKYETILGRNHYNQTLRDYCFKKYADGKYYSDCSSSVSYCYKEAGYSFGILNTVGMYNSTKLKKVDVTIVNGQIQDVSKLRPGDMLLFAGKDSSRASAGYVGHVEMVYSVGTSASDTILVGHGSNYPAKHNCKTYCANRQKAKTTTKKGNKGLIKVVRFIQDDGTEKPVFPKLSKGCNGEDVRTLQYNLVMLGYDVGKYGVDGDFGKDTEYAVLKFQEDCDIAATGVYDEGTSKYMQEALKKISRQTVEVTGHSVHVRTAPNILGKSLGVVKKGEQLFYQGQKSDNGWYLVEYNKQNAWISGKYTKLI